MKKASVCFFIFCVLLYSCAPVVRASSDRETPVVRVVREWGPNVVNIGTEKIVLLQQHPLWQGAGSQLDAAFRNYFASQTVGPVKVKSIGSGVILDSTGLIVTNAHVVHMASRVYVTLSDGMTVEGRPIGIDLTNDLALLKINPPHPLKDLKLIESKDLLVGETVIAIGNPLGLENSVSTGVVSGKKRSFSNPQAGVLLNDLIQTDAAINVGNSGGALLDADGDLIGINLAVAQNAINIGFAIPADRIRILIDKYHKHQQEEKDALAKNAGISIR